MFTPPEKANNRHGKDGGNSKNRYERSLPFQNLPRTTETLSGRV